MTDVTIRIGIDPIAEIEEFNTVVEFSMDKVTEVVQGMDKFLGMILEEEILEEVQEHIKIRTLEDRIIEVDIKETIGIKIMKEVEVGPEKDHIKIISEGMTEVIIIVDQGQDQE